ncbi:hypothetical protein [Cryobacterium adonitolivorans]|nr:hypothetical protein [Cryobacterium adonitolivorans]
MSETTTTATSTTEATTAPVLRPIIQLLDQADAGGCCGGGSCGI